MIPPRGVALGALAACLALGTPGCTDESPTERFELEGRVVDDLTDEGLADVTVTFTSETLRESSTTTGSNGRYRMAVDTDSPFGQVRAELGGYQPAERTVFFDGPTRRIDLRIRPATGDM